MTDGHTDGHSQVVAQLKLRIVAYWRTGLNFSHKLLQKTTFYFSFKRVCQYCAILKGTKSQKEGDSIRPFHVYRAKKVNKWD